jgi:hypothetical protein
MMSRNLTRAGATPKKAKVARRKTQALLLFVLACKLRARKFARSIRRPISLSHHAGWVALTRKELLYATLRNRIYGAP